MNAVNELRPADGGVLRLITAGSVDDGKSTLIGRLLYDSKGVYADQLDAIARAKHKRTRGQALDLSLLTDGLEAEREQGITIDVAYRYFATPLRKFIIADAPGHEQYTRNMVTGASTAHAAVVLVDATRAARGRLLPQTRRHSMIARLLGIGHVIVAVNKMDLVGWDRGVFERIRHAYAELAEGIGLRGVRALPLSALNGDNVVSRSPRSPWYEGEPLLDMLQTLPAAQARADAPLRLPVQWVMRHDGDRAQPLRGYAGRVASGTLRVGDAVLVQPSGERARVRALQTYDGPLESAGPGATVTVVLDRDLDVSRGDLLVHEHTPARVARRFDAELCWLDAAALNPARKYLLKHGTRLTSAAVVAVHTRRDVHDLQEAAAADTLRLNDIGRVSLAVREPLALDAYARQPATGAFILIDATTHQTAAAGMVLALDEPFG